MSEDLIDHLSGDLRPIRRGAVATRLALAIFAGAAVSLVGVAMLLGLRPDLPDALVSRMFWMKLAYTAAFAAVGAWAVERLARPGGQAGARIRWVAAPVAAIIILAGLQLSRTADLWWGLLIMGHSARLCSWLIAATATPVFLALVWAMRGLAPTRLRLAGTLAGLTAGGFGAAVYSLHCPEVGAPFVAIWYTLGILTPAAVGALLGPRLLRW